MMKWTFTSEKACALQELCDAYGPSSSERNVQQILARRLSAAGLTCRGDAIGNLYVSAYQNSDFRIGVIAHCDEIGMQITDIDEHGLLRFRKLGGLRATSLIGHRVVVLTENGIVDGVVGCDPLQDNGTETGILVKTSDLWIDIGTESREESESHVSVGDFALFKSDFARLGKYRLVGKALDDRLGGFIMSELVMALASRISDADLVGISTVQEEINMGGIAACHEPLDVAIVVDVDFATDIPTTHADMGPLAIGYGVGMNRNADSNDVLQSIFCQVAKQLQIPVQATLSRNISGGTDATIARTLGNVATINVNIPLRYMHSHYEMCDIRDIEYTINAIIGLIEYISSHHIRNFVPWQQ